MYDSFLREVFDPEFKEDIEKFLDSLDEDHSNWVCVDGEEGDYGYVTYNLNGREICRKESAGGDNDWYTFTPSGKFHILSIISRKNWY